jgi:hypothetical protein
MMKQLMALLIFLSSAFYVGCKKDEEQVDPKTFSYEFSSGYDGWTGGFADWNPPYEDNDWDFVFERTNMPMPLNTDEFGVKVAGTNLSDDLFIFMKQKVSGLQPNTTYKLIFTIELASDTPTGQMGVGGPPDAVWVKAGATITEPDTIYDPVLNIYRMNIDIGDQINSGADMINIGSIGVNDDTTEFTLISRSNASSPFTVRTNDAGEVWVIIGTDSGFESRTTVYYYKIQIEFF